MALTMTNETKVNVVYSGNLRPLFVPEIVDDKQWLRDRDGSLIGPFESWGEAKDYIKHHPHGETGDGK